ncbi:hypothetical protein CN520_25955 [Bacillus cereus]|jgi:uncharacterized membrane protein YphA (DoxX/SURF4 family)|nr:hypothetical protein CAB88_00375 [Bacillus thuringiensis]AVP45462.1 hypothetical protein C2I25_10385 [Bacillus cereus]OTW37204.1 hypothetical protein BK698_33765 [Bacillus thuringiensis serovar thuringiensis]OTW51176.1 hypothetical protein BK701_27840 [Bacillus thuringiensis serovar amagiensis]OTW81499.1 hypothetical protein BK713_15990 [Bacillus thuringiensis serovar jinghongiensis]OTW83968.1 hypothetical protein BK710_16995 [Bacillus thuringiensis serovar sumiyoshiensis]OTW91648.1 hypoth
MKHRILITNYQKGGENMDNLFQYVLHYVLLTIMIVGALLLFPFFPKFVLFLAFFIMLGIAIIISTREDATQKESRVQRVKL